MLTDTRTRGSLPCLSHHTVWSSSRSLASLRRAGWRPYWANRASRTASRGLGHAAPSRQCIRADLAFRGIQFDAQCNEAHAPAISQMGVTVTIRVTRAKDDWMIARRIVRRLTQTGAGDVSV